MTMDNDLISRSALLKQLQYRIPPTNYVFEIFDEAAKAARDIVENAPTVDAVSRPVFEQIQWERDCAMQQLKDHDIPFGGNAPDVVKVVRCKDCKHCELMKYTFYCHHWSRNTDEDGYCYEGF